MLSAKCTVQNVCNKCHQSLPDCVPKANSQPSRVSDIEIFANPSAESTTKIYPVSCKRNFICFQAKRFNTREHTTGWTTVPKQPLFEHATDGRLVSLELGVVVVFKYYQTTLICGWMMLTDLQDWRNSTESSQRYTGKVFQRVVFNLTLHLSFLHEKLWRICCRGMRRMWFVIKFILKCTIIAYNASVFYVLPVL